MGESLLEHTSIYLVNRIGERDWAVTRGNPAVLLIAFKNHYNSTELPMVWSST